MHEVRLTMRELARGLKREERRLARGIKRAMARTANKVVPLVRRNVPVAFSDLRDSVHVVTKDDGSSVVVNAPHAAAVEHGSRPHMPPVGPLISWVALRMRQGALSQARLARLPGTTTAGHAERMSAAVEMRAKPNFDKVRMRGDGSGLVAAMAPELQKAVVGLAWGIATNIAKNGTRPAHYMRRVIPAAKQILKNEVRAALSPKGGT